MELELLELLSTAVPGERLQLSIFLIDLSHLEPHDFGDPGLSKIPFPACGSRAELSVPLVPAAGEQSRAQLALPGLDSVL